MPIKGLTERRRLPRVGKIHLGFKDPERQGAPKATDYFVFPMEHAQYDELVAAFGEKPQELRIVIPLEDEGKFASQFYRCYSKTRGLICKGDGETAMRTVDVVTGALADRDSQKVEMRQMTCDGRDCPDYKIKCKETMNFQFLLPEITGLGIWQIDTSSIHSILNINGAVTLIKAVHGRVSMLPLILAVEQIAVKPEGGKKKNVWVLNLKSPTTLIEAARRAMMEPLKLIAGMGQVVDTPVPDDERPDLISPEYEPDGPQIVPDAEAGEKAARDSDFWPDGGTPGEGAKEAAQADQGEQQSGEKTEVKETPTPTETEPPITKPGSNGEPQNIQALYNWIASHGKTYNRSWFLKNFNYTEDELKDPERIAAAKREIMTVAGWEK